MSRREKTKRSPPSCSSSAPPSKAPIGQHPQDREPTSSEGKEREQENKPVYNPVAGTHGTRSNTDPGQRPQGGFSTYSNDPNPPGPNPYDKKSAGTLHSPYDQTSTRPEASFRSPQPKQSTSSQPGLPRVDSSKSTDSAGRFSDVDLGNASDEDAKDSKDYDFVPDKAKAHGRYENGRGFPFR